MLGKLLKHEFRATARFMWVIYAAMLVLSFFCHFAVEYMNGPKATDALRVLGWIAAMMWVMALVIGAVMTLVLMIRRFHKNYLTDEGYLMFTLPTSVPSLIFSKLIVTMVWLLVTALVMMLCLSVAVFDSRLLRMIVAMTNAGVESFRDEFSLNEVALTIELIVVALLGVASAIMQFYASLSIGYGFNEHKLLWSIVCYFAITILFQIGGGILLLVLTSGVVHIPIDMEPMLVIHVTMLLTCFGELAVGGILYAVTWLNLKKRLNLA